MPHDAALPHPLFREPPRHTPGPADLREAMAHTQTLLDNMVDGVVTFNAQGRIESINKAACTMFGYGSQDVVEREVSMLMPAHLQPRCQAYLQRYRHESSLRTPNRTREMQGRRHDGSAFPMQLSLSKMVRNGQPYFIGLVRDLTQHRWYEDEIRRLAFCDPLTGLSNRYLLMDRLQHALGTTRRTGRHGVLMFLDLDHFKQLNDSLGHGLGDVLLQQVGERLRSCVREIDCVARLGGDEFVVLLEALSMDPVEAATDAERIASKILAALGQPYTLRDHSFTCTPSIGIVVFLQEEETTDDLLKKADIAMYQAKAAGRNTVRFFDPAMQAAAATHAALAQDLRQGLSRGEFVLHYQIQVNGQGVTTGVEALVRWLSPTRGMVPPAHFIALAEETALILPLGQWVLESACAQLVQWRAQPETAHWSMAVNVSAQQFAQTDFVDHVVAALEKTGADPTRLKLEITESMLMSDIEDTIVKMAAIKAHGVRLSLDDFGTGYSSLSYLKRLPLDQLKIDQSFVHDLLTDPNDAVIARTIVALGHSLGLSVIAEGVETAAQRDLLLGMGCDNFQGYFFGRPVAADAVR